MKKLIQKKSKISGKRRPIVLITMALYPPYAGGGPTYFSTLVNILKEKVDFIILTQSCHGTKTIEKEDNVWIYRIQPYIMYFPFFIKYLIIPPITFLPMLYFWVKYRPIIHAHTSGVYGFVPALFSAMFQAPILKEVQDMADPAFNLKTGRVIKYISTGKTIERKLVKLGIPKKNVITYTSLVPPLTKAEEKKLKNAKRKKSKFTEVICVSALRESKGIDTLLGAFKLIEAQRKDVHLTLIGEGGLKNEAEKFIQDNNLKNITMIDRVDDYVDLLIEMVNSDILVLSSRSGEGNPRVILEVWKFKKPVIATAVGGTPDIVKDGATGILVPPENPKAFAKAVMRLVDDKKLQKKLGENGKEYVDNIPSWYDLSEELYGEYIKLWPIK